MKISFKQLNEIDEFEIIALMNNPLVRRQMPLAVGRFGVKECAEFIAAKTRLWIEQGYGPWALMVDDRFAGWGGLQPENAEPDLALVLHPAYWGLGKRFYQAIIKSAFGEMGFESVTALLPPTRSRVKGLLRLGFTEDGVVMLDGHEFNRYRLMKCAKTVPA